MVPYSAVLLSLSPFQTCEFFQRLKCHSFSSHSYANWESQTVHNLNELLKSNGSEVSFIQGCLFHHPSVCRVRKFYSYSRVYSIGSLMLQWIGKVNRWINKNKYIRWIIITCLSKSQARDIPESWQTSQGKLFISLCAPVKPIRDRTANKMDFALMWIPVLLYSGK